MSSHAFRLQPTSPREYLDAERRNPEQKHEFIAGQIYAMSGGSLSHNRISRNVLVALEQRLADHGCEALGSDQQIEVHAATGPNYVYPDVSVVCGGPPEMSDEHPDAIRNPTILVEVLSPSTQGHDYVRKLPLYRQIQSVQLILFIQQGEPHVEALRRQPGGDFDLEIIRGLDQALTLSPLPETLPLRDLYRSVN